LKKAVFSKIGTVIVPSRARARGKRGVFPERYLTLQFIDFVGKATHLLDGASNRGPKHTKRA